MPDNIYIYIGIYLAIISIIAIIMTVHDKRAALQITIAALVWRRRSMIWKSLKIPIAVKFGAVTS